jgi:hypothetical protein
MVKKLNQVRFKELTCIFSNPIILAAKDLSTEDGANFGEFKVIICGKTLQICQKKTMSK